MDTNFIIGIIGLVLTILGFFLVKNIMKNKQKISGDNNKTLNQQGKGNSLTNIDKLINQVPSQLFKCARCPTSNQELQNGLCAICHVKVQLEGYMQEFKPLSTRWPHLSFSEVEKYQDLNCKINNLRGQLSSLEGLTY